MKFSDILALSSILVAVSAAPVKRANEVEITFHGAAGAQFTQSFSTDGTSNAISNSLSISQISSATNGVECTFTGIDGSSTTVDGATQSDVGPPQTQVSGVCSQLPTQRRRSAEVSITFIGAADAQFTQSFPTDGELTTITNPLSISHIAGADGVECSFSGVDGSYTTVDGAAQVDVGPPQTQVSGSCHILAAKRSDGVSITFIGAADAQFTQSFPTDGELITITNPLSISHISGADGVECHFSGVDGSYTTVDGAAQVDVGPPQTQVSGSCSKLPVQRRSTSVTVKFIGAAGAEFTQDFPTNDQVNYISNDLSISHIEVDAKGILCSFDGIDNSHTSVYGPNTVDVGPPQTQVSGHCRAR